MIYKQTKMRNSIFKGTLLTITVFFGLFPLQMVAQIKSPKREMRGVWIASVMNLDFPSSNKLSVQAQQQEFIRILDEHAKSKLNAVFVQIRPQTDAFYFSPYEHWSEWLTGKHGTMPQPYYDPLAFMITETHARGMEFHAWFNPFRVLTDTTKAKNLPDTHITKKQPTWFMDYGKAKLFNPALPEVRSYITEVIADVARRYEIDGVHLDDYFYPYPTENIEIKDEKQFLQYGKTFSNKADWRRENINQFVAQLSQTLKQTKPYLKFGISPFPVWRNQAQDANGSATTGGLTAYDHLFADTRLWLSKGWIDYIAPQNYFSHQSDKVPYKTLTEWWAKNTFGRHLYIGHAVYKLSGKEDSKWTDKGEIKQQLQLNRQLNLQGSIFYSSKSLTTNLLGFQDSLRNSLNRHYALLPPMTWKDNVPPPPPTQVEAFCAKEGILLYWKSSQNVKDVVGYVIYRFGKDEVIDIENPSHIIAVHRQEKTVFIDQNLQGNGEYVYVITALDRANNESLGSTPTKIQYKDSGSWADFLQTFAQWANLWDKSVTP